MTETYPHLPAPAISTRRQRLPNRRVSENFTIQCNANPAGIPVARIVDLFASVAERNGLAKELGQDGQAVLAEGIAGIIKPPAIGKVGARPRTWLGLSPPPPPADFAEEALANSRAYGLVDAEGAP